MVGFWTVAQVRGNSLCLAETNLRRQSFEFYSPRFQKKVGSSTRIVPLFPGYLFVYVVDRWRVLLSTFGISRILTFADSPAKISEKVISEIRAREDKAGLVQLPQSKFKIGQRVQITSGPFSYEYGLFEGQKDSDRVRVLLSLLGRKCSVEILEGNLAAA